MTPGKLWIPCYVPRGLTDQAPPQARPSKNKRSAAAVGPYLPPGAPNIWTAFVSAVLFPPSHSTHLERSYAGRARLPQPALGGGEGLLQLLGGKLGPQLSSAFVQRGNLGSVRIDQ